MMEDREIPVNPPVDGGQNYRDGYMTEIGFVFLKAEEGFAPVPYDLGDGTRTTGYGVTERYQPEAFNSLLPSCTETQASMVMGTLLYNNFSSQVLAMMVADGVSMETLNQNQFNAFCSFAYNTGVGGLGQSVIYEMYLNGDSLTSIAERWKTTAITNAETGEVMPGLIIRREKESKMFLGEPFEMKKISNVIEGGYITENDGKGYIPPQYREVQ